MRGGATEVNETQKWATSKKKLRTTDLEYTALTLRSVITHSVQNSLLLLCVNFYTIFTENTRPLRWMGCSNANGTDILVQWSSLLSLGNLYGTMIL
jgi:hypothetical protein